MQFLLVTDIRFQTVIKLYDKLYVKKNPRIIFKHARIFSQNFDIKKRKQKCVNKYLYNFFDFASFYI